MQTGSLSGLRILLVEDDPIIALDVEDALIEAGARVVGPFNSLEHAIAAATREDVDLAVLDIDLGREEVFPAAEILSRRRIPFLFYTGRPDRAALRDQFATVPVCIKPSPRDNMLGTLNGLLRQAA